MDLGEDYFGSKKQMREYSVLLHVGVGMLVIGLFFMVSSFIFPIKLAKTNLLMIISIVLSFIGATCAIAGWLGIKEEMKKFGIKRVITPEGNLALIFGISSVFLARTLSPLPLIFGLLAILFSHRSIKKGDNMYGKSGGVCGVIGIVLYLFLLILSVLY